jgi:hypothetical protein
LRRNHGNLAGLQVDWSLQLQLNERIPNTNTSKTPHQNRPSPNDTRNGHFPAVSPHRLATASRILNTTRTQSSILVTMAQGESERVRDAQKLAKSDPRKAEQIYQEIISKPPSVTSDAAIREYELALISLGELYRDQK